MSTSQANAESKQHVGMQSKVCDGHKHPQPVDCPSPHDRVSPTRTRPCRVCFDLNLPHWSSKKECQAYRDLAIEQTGVDPDYSWGRLDIALGTLKATAEAGCPSCELLWEIWGRLPPDKYHGAGISNVESLDTDLEHGEIRIHARKDRFSQLKVFTIEFQEGEYVDNYEKHFSSISWDALPKTFQDAIIVARALGVHFVWIDSLCIIQDDGEDWAREASKMADIYENAWLTIAATAAVDGRQGLFKNRMNEGKAQISHRGLLIYLRPVVDHLEFIAYTENISRSLPLLWRGWALQEQILSSRVLHFTQEELLWECRSEMSCECSPDAVITNLREIEQSLGASRSVWGRHPAETGANMRDWYSLVERYMKRDLTYDSDRLPALSGIADAFQRTLTESGRYFAGIWEKDLIRGLLWRYVVGNELEAAEPWWDPYTILPMDERFDRSCKLARDDSFMPDIQLSPPGENLPPGSVLYFLPLIKVPRRVPNS
ncbi:hypothetical protein VMCG_06567 [Cytospora schulzeri]|uniref:Heterokaryon incompatibility domain-containing protein n=1 Tax=Cytospora schulzeri TaxID=448051 RepID=A0A423WBX8_9PEZI|nr:hypothetical protein VMCG_06567 [Valsa malicola]